MSSLLAFHNVSKSYRVNDALVPALHDINLSVSQGEIYGVIGHSGAGKSTLIRLINLLERPTSGSIWVDGQNLMELNDQALRDMRRKIGMIFQHFNLLSSKTVAQNIAFPLEIAKCYTADEIKRRVGALMDRVGLGDQAHKYPAQLSGGQKQRVGIARALANEPRVLLCDEATSALDPQTTQSVLRLLNEINVDLKLTIVLITHEMNVIRSLCDHVAVLDGGRVMEEGKVSDVFLHPQHETSRRFVYESEAWDESTIAAAFAHVKGKLVRLTFRGDKTYEPVLSSAMREHDIEFYIVSGRIDKIKNVPYGQLVISLNGKQIDEALAYFRAREIRVEEMR
ncbi:MAG: methionine ABC transporter ATP-binding protein [Burkholderiales bacterium]|jgi:D-methionine transport system ATP-binding protein|nr:methionine ABC transporter ATP-binding protein [Burkholderiales bacterium]